jgi:hypothetical protein
MKRTLCQLSYRGVVGPRGFEPRSAAISGQCSNQLELEAHGGRRSSRSPPGCPGHLLSKQRLPTWQLHLPWRRTEKSNPLRFTRIIPLRTGGRALTASSSMAEGTGIEPVQDSRPDSRFPAGCLASRPTFHERRAENSDPTAAAAHSLAARASTLAGSLSNVRWAGTSEPAGTRRPAWP